MENVKEIIAKNLVELRKSRKYTQQQLAEKLNYSDKAISRWEHAESLPDIETLCKIADYYHVTLDYLVGRKFVLDIGYLSDDQKEIVHLIQQLDDNSLQPVKALLKSMIDNK